MKITAHVVLSPSRKASSRSRLRSPLLLLGTVMLFLSARSISFAGSATWKTVAPHENWNAAGNWTAGGPPNGAADTATFNTSQKKAPFLSADTEVNGIVFNAGASPFTIIASPTFALSLSGVGITNNSGTTQNFVTAVKYRQHGEIFFANSATAGDGTLFTNGGGAINGGGGGLMSFLNTSSAGNGTFINNGGMHNNAGGAFIEFSGNSSAGSGTFTNNGGAIFGGNGGRIFFDESSTADHGTFTNNGPSFSSAGSTVGTTVFAASSTAGNGTFINNGGTVSGSGGGYIFFDEGSAGSGTFTINGGAVSGADGGGIGFEFSSPAGNGTFTINGGAVSSARGGLVSFSETSTAGDATLILNGGAVRGANGGDLFFTDSASAGNAKLIAKGDVGGGRGSAINFFSDATGGTAQVGIFDKATMDISGHSIPGITIGSLEGNGVIFLGARNLTVGSNNLTTSFSGLIRDRGSSGGNGGSLSKIGSGTLVLSNANTYTGGTTVTAGNLSITNASGSGTGSGAVQVDSGTLGGTGAMAGAVTVGDGGNPRAFLSPGIAGPGALATQGTLTFKSDATYKFELDSSSGIEDQVVANGVTINGGAQFTFADRGSGTLPAGTVFTVINNTAATPIAGTFSNLTDGSTFTVNGNTFRADYEGGDGNDLTLTVQ